MEEAEYLPIKFTVKSSSRSGVTAQTPSGHEFQLSRQAAPSDTEFALADLQADSIEEHERPTMAHAILNEIIGVSAPKKATANAQEGSQTN